MAEPGQLPPRGVFPRGSACCRRKPRPSTEAPRGHPEKNRRPHGLSAPPPRCSITAETTSRWKHPGTPQRRSPRPAPAPPRTPPHSPNRPNRQITPLTPAWNTTACAHLHFLLAHRRPFLPAKRPEIPMQPAINRQMQPPSQNSRAIPSLTNKSGLPRLDNPLIPPPNQLTVTGICRNTIGA